MTGSVLDRLDAVRTAAAKSGGFITTAELRALGVPMSTGARWCSDGLLVRLERGVYRAGGTGFGFDEALHFAQKVMGNQQAIGGRSALAVWDLPGGSKGRVQVVGPKGSRSGVGKLAVAQVGDLRPVDITTKDGLRVTTAMRSIIDAARTCDSETIGEQLSVGVVRGLFTYDEMAKRLSELTRQGKQGLWKIRELLVGRVDDPGRQLNSYERMASRLFATAGLPRAVAQHHVVVRGRAYFADFAWPEAGLLVECDSMLAHSSAGQLQADLRRQNDLVSAGWTVLRFTYWDVVDRPDYVVDSINRALA